MKGKCYASFHLVKGQGEYQPWDIAGVVVTDLKQVVLRYTDRHQPYSDTMITVINTMGLLPRHFFDKGKMLEEIVSAMTNEFNYLTPLFAVDETIKCRDMTHLVSLLFNRIVLKNKIDRIRLAKNKGESFKHYAEIKRLKREHLKRISVKDVI